MKKLHSVPLTKLKTLLCVHVSGHSTPPHLLLVIVVLCHQGNVPDHGGSAEGAGQPGQTAGPAEVRGASWPLEGAFALSLRCWRSCVTSDLKDHQ